MAEAERPESCPDPERARSRRPARPRRAEELHLRRSKGLGAAGLTAAGARAAAFWPGLDCRAALAGVALSEAPVLKWAAIPRWAAHGSRGRRRPPLPRLAPHTPQSGSRIRTLRVPQLRRTPFYSRPAPALAEPAKPSGRRRLGTGTGAAAGPRPGGSSLSHTEPRGRASAAARWGRGSGLRLHSGSLNTRCCSGQRSPGLEGSGHPGSSSTGSYSCWGIQ